MKHKITFALGALSGLLAAALFATHHSYAETPEDGPLVLLDETKMDMS